MTRLQGIACGVWLIAATASAQTAPAVSPDRFAAEMHTFDEADRISAPPQGAVVFTGSSSIRLWNTMARDFPGVVTVNRGFGGSELEDAIRYLDRVVLRYRPGTVVLYSGDNDLNGGKGPARVAADYRRFVDEVHRALPQTRVIIIAIKPSPARWALVDRARQTNRLVQNMVAADPKRLRYVDVFTPMLGGDGKPRPELYVADGLHMTPAGYEIWKAALAPALR